MKSLKAENCWKCESDLISVDSSSSVKITQIKCTDCGTVREYRVNEESAIRKWNKERQRNTAPNSGMDAISTAPCLT